MGRWGKTLLCSYQHWRVALHKAFHSSGGEGCSPVAADLCAVLSLQDQELESLAAIEAELERVAHKLHELRRG